MIPLARPFFDSAETDAITEVMASGMVSQGEKVEEFEDYVRRYCGAKYAVAVSSCTAGLYLALRSSVDIWNTRVAIPAFTFPAAQMCVEHFGGEMTIEHVDVEKDTYNLDIDRLELKLDRLSGTTNTIGAIIPISQFGLPYDVNRVKRLGKKYDIPVIEDQACALGSEYKGERIGKRGTAIFSFHGRKIITCGEGGMVVTDDEELYEKILQGRQFGRNSRGEFQGSGLNFKMSDIHAAIGIAQMEKLPEILSLRDEVAKTYNELLYTTEETSFPPNNFNRPKYRNYEWYNGTYTNWQSYVVRLPLPTNRQMGPINGRNLIIERMRNDRIECQVGSYDNSDGTCKVSEELAKTTLALPIWPGMTKEMVERVVTTLEEAMK